MAKKKCSNCDGRGWVALDMMGEDIVACDQCKTMKTRADTFGGKTTLMAVRKPPRRKRK